MSEVDASAANGETSDSGAGAGAGDAGAGEGNQGQGGQDTTIIGGGGGNNQANKTEGEGEGGQSADSGDKGTDEGTGDGAPESYADFVIPEGVAVDGPLMEGFKAVAKELNLSQEAAQKIVDIQTKHVLAQEQAKQDQAKQVVQNWTNELKADPVFGGDKFDENVATVQKAIRTFAGENIAEIEAIFNGTGLGSHPSIVKMFLEIGKRISEDSFQHGHAVNNAPKDAAEVLYGPTGVREKQ